MKLRRLRRISQIRRNRQCISFAEALKIANALEIEPLEILAALEFPRARECDKDGITKQMAQAPQIRSKLNFA